jgi:Haem-binding domain
MMNGCFRVTLPALLICLALAVFGCSSSQGGNASAAAPAAASGGISADPQVNAILTTSCYGCHATGGTVPWYAAVSPTYLAAGSARKVLNFSDWQTYDEPKKAAELKSIANSVSGGSMPPGDYTALDHSARLTDAQKQALINWATQAAAAVAAH